MRQLGLFILLLVVWLLLVWPFGVQDVLAGAIVAGFIAWLLREPETQGLHLWTDPRRYFWLFTYVLVLAYYVVKANVDVAYRVLHPAMPISPGIVKVKTGLRTQAALAALANSITLTPGTLTVNAMPDGTLYVHWINVLTTDSDGATKIIVERFEWFLKRIFE